MGSWEIVQLGNVCDVVSGITPSTLNPELWDGDIKWIAPAEISDNSYFIYDTVKHISKKAGLKLMPVGTVLLSSRAPIGKVAIAGSEMCCNQGFKNLICSEKIHNRYLYRFLKSKTEYLNSLGRGATFKEISKPIVEQIRIPLPPLPVQQKIADVLDKASALIEKRKAQIDKLDLLIKSQFIKMFGSAYNEYEHVGLPEMCNFIDYRGKTPEKSNEGIPLITAKNVKENQFSIEPKEYIPSNNYDAVMTRGIPCANDVLFTTEAPLGNVCRIPYSFNRFCVGQRIITMQPHKKKVTSEYLERALLTQRFQEEMWQKSSGSTVKGIRSKELALLKIPLPPLPLQNEFSALVQQVEAKKALLQQSLEKLELNYKSLTQKCFSGELF